MKTGTQTGLAAAILAMATLCHVGCSSSDESNPADTSAGGSAGAAGTGGGSSGAAGSSGPGGSAGSAGSGPAGGNAGSAGTSGSAGTAGSAGQAGAPSCPVGAMAETLANVDNGSIDEASGLAASRGEPNVLWVHNDSGDSPRLFAIDSAGKTLATANLAIPKAVDWEDMAIGPGPQMGTSYVYVGDIGDNPQSRPNIQIHRFAEPSLGASSDLTVNNVDSFTVIYGDKKSHNNETLMVDPSDGSIILVTKTGSGESRVYRLILPMAPNDPSSPLEAEYLTTVTFGPAGLKGSIFTTAGDISPDGRWWAIRTYNSAYLWHRAPGQPIKDVFEAQPCPIALPNEPQGETFAFSPDGAALYSLSEGKNQPLYRIKLSPGSQ